MPAPGGRWFESSPGLVQSWSGSVQLWLVELGFREPVLVQILVLQNLRWGRKFCKRGINIFGGLDFKMGFSRWIFFYSWT